MPDEVSGIADLTVNTGTAATYPYPLGLSPAVPELFAQADGSAQAAAVNADSSLNSRSNPAVSGTYVSL